MENQRDRQNWWGKYRFSSPDSLVTSLRIGALCVTIQREPMEWGLTYEWVSLEDPSMDRSWEKLERDVGLRQSARFVMEQTEETLHLTPALADRPIVTSPRIPLHIPPQEKAVLFVGSPLWLRMFPEGSETVWPELPIRRPTDTWFGGSTQEGELCYAVRTKAVLNPERLATSARRALTPVVIHNQAADLFQVQRLKIPVEHLCLYADPAGGLWTEQIVVTNSGDSSLTQVQIDPGPPRPAGDASLLSAARKQSEENLWSRVFAPVQWFQEFTKV